MLFVMAAMTSAAQAAGIPKTWVDTEAGSPTGPYLVIDLTPRKIAVEKQPDPDTPPRTVDGFVVSNLAAVPPDGWTAEHKTTKLVLRRIQAGTFLMGSPPDELGRDADETQHSVTIARDFYIGVFEVTVRQWELVMSKAIEGHNKIRHDPGAESVPQSAYLPELHRRPVEMITFYEIRENPATDANPSHDPNVDWPANSAVNPNSFFGRLRTKTSLVGLDLPTEAQWEYACRAGTTTALNSGKGLTQARECPNLAEVGRYLFNTDPSEAWRYNRNDVLGTAGVGSYAPNKWGLYDMHGNVWERCLDWYGPLSFEAVTDPKGAVSGQARVVRGGGWDDRAKACRAANRGPAGDPAGKNGFFGCRVALTLP
jgi:formylglycine-generating enzyme required for sulfatase activity